MQKYEIFFNQQEIFRNIQTTMYDYFSNGDMPHDYEVTEIELLEGTHGDDNNGELPRSGNNSISAAKLLKNIEKSYDKGKKLLYESSSELEDSDVRSGGASYEQQAIANAMLDRYYSCGYFKLTG